MNATGLGRHFWQQVTAQVLPGLNRTLGVWEDDQPQPHPDDLPKKAFGNIWQAQSTIKSAVDRQFDAVLSGPWYAQLLSKSFTCVYAAAENLDLTFRCLQVFGPAKAWWLQHVLTSGDVVRL